MAGILIPAMSSDLRSLEDSMRRYADGPEDERKAAQRAHMERLLVMREEERREAIRLDMLALNRLDRIRRRTMIKSWVEALAELAPEKRRSLLMSGSAALSDMPDIERDQKTLLQEVLPELPEPIRNVLSQEMGAPTQPSAPPSLTQAPPSPGYTQWPFGQMPFGPAYWLPMPLYAPFPFRPAVLPPPWWVF